MINKENLYYDLKRLRTGSLLKDVDTYYVVLGFGNEVLDRSTVIIVAPFKVKPLHIEDVMAKQKELMSYFIFETQFIRPPKVIKYDYFSEEDSKVFLTKYHMMYPEDDFVYKMDYSFVTSKRAKQGKIYCDYMCQIKDEYYSLFYIRIKEFLFTYPEKKPAYNIKQNASIPLIEVTENYVKAYYERY